MTLAPPVDPSFFPKIEFRRERSALLELIDKTATKNEIRDALKLIAGNNGETLSRSRANNLADKFKKGEYDPRLARILQYRDPTADEAVRKVMEAAK